MSELSLELLDELFEIRFLRFGVRETLLVSAKPLDCARDPCFEIARVCGRGAAFGARTARLGVAEAAAAGAGNLKASSDRKPC